METLQEQTHTVECMGCEAPITPGAHRSFGYAAGAHLCYGCAVSKGGVYDFQREIWMILPDMAGESDEGSWW